MQQVAQFLETLNRDLHRGVGSRLDSLLGQCMYFGLSFSRVGADFRGQLAPIFQQVAMDTFRKAIQEAVEKFQEDMNLYTLISLPSILGSTIPPAIPSTQPGTLQPPMALLDFPPLACFLNNVLTAFNDLRLCCPIGLAQEVSRCIEEALIKVTKLILVFHRAEESAFSSRERELFVQFCSAFAEDMVPFLNRCLQVLFPPAQLALILGVPPTQVSKYGSLGCINMNTVLEPLQFVLPQKEPVTPVLDLCTDLNSLMTSESDPTTADKHVTPHEEKPFVSEPEEPVSVTDPQKDDVSAEAVHTEQNNTNTEPEITLDAQNLTDELPDVEEMLSN